MKRTKELLTDTFWELLEEKAYSKITVNDIVSRCDEKYLLLSFSGYPILDD